MLSVALALVPTGFTENPVLNARAAYIAQKPVHVYCAPDDASWAMLLTSLNDVAPEGGQIHGVTPVVGGDTAYIDAEGCHVMLARIARKNVALPVLGATLDVLTVESLHMRGLRDDGQTACAALRVLPKFLIARWGFRKNGPGLARAIYGATNYFKRQPPQYHTGGCG